MASLITPAHRLTRNIHFASIELKNNRELFMRARSPTASPIFNPHFRVDES